MYNENNEFLNDEQQIKIEPQIKSRLWKLSETEYENLKQSIVVEGCRDALILWNDILVDGHNRYSICKENLIPFTTKQKEFSDLNEVLRWVDMNQLSRRNLTDEQRTIILGRISKMHKMPSGVKVGQNGLPAKGQEKIAEELKVGLNTLKRAEKYVDAIDGIERNLGKDITEKILNRDIKVTKEEVIKIGSLKPEEQERLFTKLQSGEKYHSATSAMKETVKETHFEARKSNPLPANVQIYNDDCRNILKTLTDNSVDMLLTDPPYGIDFKPSHSPNKNFKNDSPEYIADVLEGCCKLWQRKLKRNAHLYIFCGWGGYPLFHSIITKYFEISNVLIWKKNNSSVCDFDMRYAFTYEMIVYARQFNTEARMLNYKLSRDVLEFDKVSQTDHACVKPVDLLEYLINNSTVENETVLDCFAGSFNSGIAATNLNRNYIGIELDPKWYKVGENKLKSNKN